MIKSNKLIKSSTIIISSLFVINNYNKNQSYSDYSAPFDPRGFPNQITPYEVTKQAKSMYLSGVGMRKKNIYITNVDVYLVGLCLTADSLAKGKLALSSGKNLSEAILEDNNNNQTKYPKISIPLKFVRNVSTNTVVEAFNDAFIGCYEESVKHFKSILRESIGTTGMKKDDEIAFYWLSGGGLVISKNGIKGEIINNIDIEKRLLEVYIDPTRSVSPELVQSIQSNMAKIEI